MLAQNLCAIVGPTRMMDSRLEQPEFWAAHYYLLLGTEDREGSSFLEPFFGVNHDQVLKFWRDELEHPDETWDLLTLDVNEVASVAVEYADCGESGSERRFYVGLANWDQWELLGYDSPHFALPAFRWEEIALLGSRNSLALLLLLPSITWPSNGDVSVIERAWQQNTFARVKLAKELAHQIVTSLPSAEAKPARDLPEQGISYVSSPGLNWWNDRDLGWINDGRYSFRNPHTRMTDFSRERFDRVKEFFAAFNRELRPNRSLPPIPNHPPDAE